MMKTLTASGLTIQEKYVNKVLKMNIGETVQEILVEAQKENRLICGLNNASKYLKEADSSDHLLFFFIAPSLNGDSLAHMQEVVLQSFCFENDIYIIKIDSAEKLSKIVGSVESVTCALIQKCVHQEAKKYSDIETRLIDHCEDFWDEVVQPVIKLPEKWGLSDEKHEKLNYEALELVEALEQL